MNGDAFEIGDIVWAKMKGSRAWPAELIELNEHIHGVSRPKKSDKIFVQFFGEQREIGFVNEEKIWGYKEYRIRYGDQDKPNAVFKKAVLEADKFYFERNGVKLGSELQMEEVLDDCRKVLVNSSNSPSEIGELATQKIHPGRKRRTPTATDLNGPIQEDTVTKKSRSSQSVYDFDDEQPKSPRKNTSPKKLSGPPESTLESRDVGHSSKIKDRKTSPPEGDKPLKLGVIGLGTIASAVVEVLARAGYRVTIWNRTASKCRDMQKKLPQLTISSTPAELVKSSDIIFSCLSDPYAVKDIIFGKNGVMESLDAGKGYVEMSILGPETIEDCERVIKGSKCSFLEVQVLGTRRQILSKQVELLASGNKDLYERCGSCLAAFSRSSKFLGETCYATYIMLSIAMLRANLTAAVAESLTFAERTGVSADLLANVIRSSQESLLNPSQMVRENLSDFNDAIFSSFPQPWREMMSKRPPSGGVALQHVQKDLRVVIDVADYLDLPLPVTAASNEVYKRAKSLGYKKDDRSSLIHTVRKHKCSSSSMAPNKAKN